jgi:hypothetical protein
MRGFLSKAQPARTVEEPARQSGQGAWGVLTQVDDQRRVATAALVAVAVDGLDALEGRLVQHPYLGRRRLGRVAPGVGGVSNARHGDGSMHGRMVVKRWGENLGRSEERLGRLHRGGAIRDQRRPIVAAILVFRRFAVCHARASISALCSAAADDFRSIARYSSGGRGLSMPFNSNPIDRTRNPPFIRIANPAVSLPSHDGSFNPSVAALQSEQTRARRRPTFQMDEHVGLVVLEHLRHELDVHVLDVDLLRR